MAAADVNLGRSSEDWRDIAAAAAVVVEGPGPLRTLKRRLEVLGLHRIITHISLATSAQSQRVGFNEKKRHVFLKVMGRRKKRMSDEGSCRVRSHLNTRGKELTQDAKMHRRVEILL